MRLPAVDIDGGYEEFWCMITAIGSKKDVSPHAATKCAPVAASRRVETRREPTVESRSDIAERCKRGLVDVSHEIADPDGRKRYRNFLP